MPLEIIAGFFVGFFLGLTGGGGSILAVPLLVYGAEIPVAQAIVISLITVAFASLFGALKKAQDGLIDYRVSFLMAACGMMFAPFGAYVNSKLDPKAVLYIFAILMFLISYTMWRRSKMKGPRKTFDEIYLNREHKKQILRVLASGCGSGFLTGLLGVGGGFLIVPSLNIFTRLEMKRAIGSSMVIMTIVSFSALISHASAFNQIPWWPVFNFAAGGLLGVSFGTQTSSKMSDKMLQRFFAFVIFGVAIYVLHKV